MDNRPDKTPMSVGMKTPPKPSAIKCNNNTMPRVKRIADPGSDVDGHRWSDIPLQYSELVPSGAVDVCFHTGQRYRSWLSTVLQAVPF